MRRTLTLFNHGFDHLAHEHLAAAWPMVSGGFNLFSFPSQLRLAWLDLERMASVQCARAKAQGLNAVVSHEEQFGALTAALVAERMGWPGTPVEAVLACQHKLHARRVLQAVCPEANIPYAAWYGASVGGTGSACNTGPKASAPLSPEGSMPAFPLFAKPIKSAFSILAREVKSEEDLCRLVSFGPWERQLLRWLGTPFERVAHKRLPQAGSSMGMLLEAPVHAPQFNLDGYVVQGRLKVLGVVDAVMYPGTQAFMRFDYPSRLAPQVIEQATEVARRFLDAVGFTHGSFNMEFFHDEATQQIKVIEINPRLASQFSNLYERVDGVNLHEIALALAHGLDPSSLPRREACAAATSSFVYRSFEAGGALQLPDERTRHQLIAQFPDALLMPYPKTFAEARRDYKWLGSCRHAILHLAGQDTQDLQHRCEAASQLLGWPVPYAHHQPVRSANVCHVPARPVDHSLHPSTEQRTPA